MITRDSRPRKKKREKDACGGMIIDTLFTRNDVDRIGVTDRLSIARVAVGEGGREGHFRIDSILRSARLSPDSNFV